MKVALVGSTGLVGSTFLKVMEERSFPIVELMPVASARSVGKQIEYDGTKFEVMEIAQALDKKPDLAFFTAGSSVSKEWAPAFAEKGILVIDNSSAWRMAPEIPLVIPEINGNDIQLQHKIIANPNCSTIQLLMGCWQLHKAYQIERMVISTYQSVSGSGQKAIDQMWNERSNKEGDKIYPHPIDLNCIPHCGDFDDDGNTEEELKLMRETAKILDPSIKVSATAVRVPVSGGHSEAVNIRFSNPFELKDVLEILSNSPGIKVLDDQKKYKYPMPLLAADKDDVFVGRVRRDKSEPNSLNMWIVADNLRKGAATNAVQIAEYCLQKGLLNPQ
ncbi:MAG: aspartate-semialdehyde dehydrogenase [Saprospirales bacterium]|nr:MAG: aspartate-semialdehyde dehydrogenase [Saprospirales bacterium]